LVPAVVVILLVVVALGVAVTAGQRHLIYFPDRSDPGPAASHAPNVEDVRLVTEDGLTLTAWLVHPASGTANAKNAAVLYLPGNGGNRLGRLDTAQVIAGLGYTVLLAEYRGYGGNPGTPSETGLARDARAAAAYLRNHGFPGSRTIYVGESIGTGVAVRLATTDPPAGVLLRSPYTSLVDVGKHQFPWLPVGLILRDRFDTLAYLPKVSAPITVLAGSADTLIPASQSATVAERAPSLFRHVVVDGAGHNDIIWYGPDLAEQVDDLASAVIPRD
jgi:fermentation-respiration switch protein FrsA (DUF1100 family)